MTVKPEGYFGLMSGQCFCRIACMIGVNETKQIYTDSDVMRLRKPDLTIQVTLTKLKFKIHFTRFSQQDLLWKNTLYICKAACIIDVLYRYSTHLDRK